MKQQLGIEVLPDEWRIVLEREKDGPLEVRPLAEHEKAEGTVFRVRPLPPDLTVVVLEPGNKGLAHRLVERAGEFVVGWEGLRDREGREIPYAAEKVSRVVPHVVLAVIAGWLFQRSMFGTGIVEGNGLSGPSQSARSDSGAPTEGPEAATSAAS